MKRLFAILICAALMLTAAPIFAADETNAPDYIDIGGADETGAV